MRSESGSSQAHGTGASAALTSAPVNTATTPSIPAAALVSMLVIFACAYGLRRMAAWAMPGSTTSSV